MKIKCSACRSRRLKKVKDVIKDFVNPLGIDGEFYICMKCGHIDIYSPSTLKIIKAREIKEDNSLEDKEIRKDQKALREVESSRAEMNIPQKVGPR